jgi:hypothetical protein
MLAPVRFELRGFSDGNLSALYGKFPGCFDRQIMPTPQVMQVLRFVRQFKGVVTLLEPKPFGKIVGSYYFHGKGPVPLPVVLSKKAQRKKDLEAALKKAGIK